ncbi:Ig-like domain-containing protein [Candidatus Uhrbacteria bacterium]|nr:Ig-like domain-containing protein [Candidatus Uhrbacteria bacterium]
MKRISALPLAFIALAGCVALIPPLNGSDPAQTSSSAKPAESPLPTGSQDQSPAPNTDVSSSPSVSPSVSASVYITPSPSQSAGQTSSPSTTPVQTATPVSTPIPTPTPTPASYAVKVQIRAESSTTIHVSAQNPDGQLNPVEVKLNAIVTMSDTSTNSSVTWSSSDPGIASVQNGVVRSQSEGVAAIIAASLDGKASSSLSVTVKSGGKVNVIVE